MTSSGKPLAIIHPRLWLALLVSILLHLLLVAGSADWLPDWLPEDEPMEVTLAYLPPPPPKPVPKVAPTPKPPPATAQPKAKPIAAMPAAIETPSPPPPTTVEQPAVQPAPPTAEAAVHEAAPPAETPAPEVPVAATPPEHTRPAPPRYVELEFLVDYNGARAIEKQRYQAFEDGRYILSSTAEAKGLLSLALSDLNQKSEGTITPQGLKPNSFTYQYGTSAKKLQKASFDWVGKSLSMEAGDRKQVVPLEEGTQDLLSFLYQFMFTPPLEQFQLAVTTGKKIKTYQYFFEGEEEISTQLGTLRALHIAKSSGKGEEKAELWLAEDYHYLPVKIRKTDADGKVVQSTISKIKLDESP
jgi:hypothetical protein